MRTIKDASALNVAWRKSSFSGGDNNCVEVAPAGVGVYLRDSKDPHGPAHQFSGAEWGAFLAGVKAGEFDN
ncbi:DUF397 domain-containing protein [Streptomyces sp. NPDC050507]|uniref:DUF397 domain-containing protein n=1 Tax=Streptomyces sp. NPDC050507 TaxID=3365619 RepID=UPI00379FA9F3